MPTPTYHRDLSDPEHCDRSLERARRRRTAADAVRRQLARRRRATGAVLTAMLAGPPVQLAAAQTTGGDDDSTPTESPVRARDAQPSSLFFSVGSEGAAVADIQRSLGVAADGIFGPDTAQAVRAYQGKHGLVVDGIVGPRTWAALFGGQAAAAESPKQSAPAPSQAESKQASAAQSKGGLVFVLDGGKQAEAKPAKKAKPARKAEPKVVKFKIRPHKAKKDRGGGSCSSSTLKNPVPGSTKTGYFGEQRPGHTHSGVDLAIESGTPIHAAACGIVTELGNQGGYGNMVCIKHSSRFTTCYAHMQSFNTRVGSRVKVGQVIGFVGCTGSCSGPHVHFEARVNGTAQDPEQYMGGGGRSIRARRASAGQSASTYSQPATQSGTSGTYSGSGTSYSGSSGGTSYQAPQQAPVYRKPSYQYAPQAQPVAPPQQVQQAQPVAPAPQVQPQATTPAQPVVKTPAPSTGGQQGGQGDTPAVELPEVKTPDVPGVTTPAQPTGEEQGSGEAQQPQASQPAQGTGSTGSGSASTGSTGSSGTSAGTGSTGSSGSGTGQ